VNKANNLRNRADPDDTIGNYCECADGGIFSVFFLGENLSNNYGIDRLLFPGHWVK